MPKRGLAIVGLLAFVGLAALLLVGGKPSPAEENTSARPAITEDLEAYNQKGERVRISELRGKVWAVTEFFAVCPLCVLSHASDLKALAEKFAGHADFHLVCVSIDPERDDVGRLADYAAALGADAGKWWFLTGKHEEVHGFLESGLKFAPVGERGDPGEIEALGRYEHDLGIMVVDREMRIVGKRNLSWAAEQSADLRDQWERHLHGIIEHELARKAQAP